MENQFPCQVPGLYRSVGTRRLVAAAIWHNETTHHPGPARSLLAYDH